MKLHSATGSFELSITGYAAQAASGRERGNLACRISTRWRQQADTQAAPMRTWEVQRLVSVLKSLWSNAASRVSMSFAQPGLAVDGVALANDQYRLHIQFGPAITPTWHPYPDFPLEMDMVLSGKQLQEAILSLSTQLATYPEQ